VSQLLPFFIIGITSGSLYGLAALGLVLTYRTSGIFNFAHGALAAAAAYFFYTLHFSWGWPWPVAAFIAVGVFGPVAGILMERMARGLVSARTSTIIVATVGLLLFIQGFLFWRYGSAQRSFPEFLPTRTALTISGVAVSWAQVINVGVGTLSFLGLYLFLRRTRLGVAMRGVVAAPQLLGLAGTNPVRVRVASWVIGCSFAALTGILIAPTLTLNASLLSALVVQAFGAVAIGAFASLPLTYVGGMAVGIIAALATKYLGSHPPFNGLPAVVPFLVLIAMMLVTPPRKLPRGAGRFEGAAAGGWRPPLAVTVGGTLLGTALLAAVPRMVGTRLPVYSTALVFVILFLSLSLLTRVSGQISLAHAAFAGVGAAAFSHLTVDAGYPWLVGLVGAGLITGLVGAVLALPSMRLSGLYLALATFGFGLLMEAVVFQTWLLFGKGGQGLAAKRPEFGPIHGDSTTAYYYVILALVAISCGALVALRRARLGRFLRAMADSPTGLTTLGLGLNVTRVIVFASSAFFAGVAGALFIAQVGNVSPVTFNSLSSLLYLAAITVAGAVSGFATSAFLAAGLLVVFPTYMTSVTVELQSMMFGGAAVVAALVSDGQVDWAGLRVGVGSWLDRALSASERRRRRSPITSRGPQIPVAAQSVRVES
jgi:branched-subunit amino acid ABC-type transport system permease component